MKILAAAGMALIIGLASPAHADDPFDSALNDHMFAMLLNDYGILFNFNYEKADARKICNLLGMGETLRQAGYELARSGAYTEDVASHIATSAEVAYCRIPASQV
jgi:hypothetical protein